MAKLYLKNTHQFENLSRRIFMAGGELFGASGETAKKVTSWVDTKGVSSPEAQALADDIGKQKEEILNGTREELLELYVNLFAGDGVIGPREAYKLDKAIPVGETYTKNGLLQVLEKNSGDLRIAFGHVDDLRLLAYATIYDNFKKQGLDANYLPKGATVTLENGEVTVTYTEKDPATKADVIKTAKSEIFPWSTYDIAQAKYAALKQKQAEEARARIVAEGGDSAPLDLDGDGVPDATPTVEPSVETPPPVPAEKVEAMDERSEYQKRLDTKVDTFRDEHGLTEDAEPGRIGLHFMEGTGTYVATLKKPDGELVSINVRATVTDNADQTGLEQALEKALDEELARLDRMLDRKEKREEKTAPVEAEEEAEKELTDLEKDWQRAWTSVQAMVAADERLQGKVAVTEGPRNKRGADKTIVVTNTETGEVVRYMVGVKEKNGPKTYGPTEGGAEDPARVEDAKSIRVSVLVMGNGTENEKIGSRVSKYIGLEGYHIPNVEKGAYNMALIMAGIDPIEEPASPALFDVIFRDFRNLRERVKDKKLSTVEGLPTSSPEQIPGLIDAYPLLLSENVDALIARHPDLFGVQRQTNLVDPGNPDGFSSFSADLEMKEGKPLKMGAQVKEITAVQVDAFIEANGGLEAFTAAGVTRKQAQEYLSYYFLEQKFNEELKAKEASLTPTVAPAPGSPEPSVEATLAEDPTKAEAERVLAMKAATEAVAMDALFTTGPDGKLALVKTWSDVDAQYKKMRAELPPEQISARNHLRGAQAAAIAGRIGECSDCLDLAVKNSEGSLLQKDVLLYQDYFKKNFGSLSLELAPGSSYAYIPAPGRTDLLKGGLDYDTAAIQYATAELQKTGKFEGRMPLGTYEVGTMVYTVTAEGTTVVDKAQVASTAADALNLSSTTMTPDEVRKTLEGYRGTKGADARGLMARYPVGDSSYLEITRQDLPDPNPDGSVHWRVDLTPTDGSGSYILEADVKAVDMAQVQAYIDAQAALGVTYSKNDLVEYLAYRAIAESFSLQANSFNNPSSGLDEKYHTYLAKAASVPKGLPVGDYQKVSSLDFDPEEAPINGLVTLTCMDGTTFQGTLKNNVPDGMGVVTLGGADETLGPVAFMEGRATVELTGGIKKELHWNPDRSAFDVREL